MFNPCGGFWWSLEGPVIQIHSPRWCPWDLLRSVQMLREREWCAKSNGKLLHLFIPGKTPTLVPAFAVKDLPLGRTHWRWIDFTVSTSTADFLNKLRYLVDYYWEEKISESFVYNWDFQISDLVKTLMQLIFNPCGEFRQSPQDPVKQIHSPHLHVVSLGSFQIFEGLFRS